jgi:hypothetical protein
MSRAREKEVEEEAVDIEQQGPLPISKLEVLSVLCPLFFPF